jgi:capsular exopolysaccharide synthesis family protein
MGPAGPGGPGYGYGPGWPQEWAGEDDEHGTLIQYWRTLKRRRGTVILGGVLGLVAATLYTLPQTPVYRAATTLEIQELNPNFMNMQNIQQFNSGNAWDPTADIQTQIRILQSATLVERVMKSMEMKKASDFTKETGRVSAWRKALNLPEPKAEDRYSGAVEAAAGGIGARALGATRIIEVSVDSTEPKVAAEFANRLAAEFIEANVQSRWESTQKTGEWLTKQLDDMRIKLEKSEDSLQEYARGSGLVMTGAGDKEQTNVNDAKLSQLQTSLTTAQTERVGKQSRYEMAVSAPPESLPDVLQDAGLREYQTKLTELGRQRAELLETFTASHPKVKRVDAQAVAIEKSFERERGAIVKRIKNEYDEAVRRERLLQADFAKQTAVVNEQSEKAIHYGILKREVETNRSLYETTLQRVKEAGIASAMRASNVRVVDPASAPGAPFKPNHTKNAGAGLLAGLVLGVVFVIVTDRANRTLQDPSDAPFYLGLPELGVIPAEESLTRTRLLPYGGKKKAGELALTVVESGGLPERLELVTWQKRPSMMAESFRAALTSVLFAGQNGASPKMIVVTSANPGEGKTTVASNLAIALAETGQRVLLMDADTRKPRLHDVFQLGNERGLTTMLAAKNGAGSEGAVQETRVPNLFVLPSGPGVAGPTNLLYSKRFPEYLRRFQEEFDMVLIDTPPMLQIPDARVLGKLAGSVILVVRAGKTTRDAALAARSRLRDDGIAVMGTIMNDWNPKHSPGGYYGAYDGYAKYYRGYKGGSGYGYGE